MDRDKLPVEILDNELPKDNKYYDSFEENINNAGFASWIFLLAIMMVCFLWGMLVVILK